MFTYKQYTTLAPHSLLFVPGNDKGKLDKALKSRADAIVLDLEDGVVPADKDAARRTWIEFGQVRPHEPAMWLRVNPTRSPHFLSDMEACAQTKPDVIVLPKSESASDIEAVLDATAGFADMAICALIETPLGLLHAKEVAQASKCVIALAFGAEDFSSALGIQHSPEQTELLYARCSIVTVAKALGMAAIDSPSFALSDLEAVHRDAARSKQLGFGGMFAIHPQQIPVITEIFAPSTEELREARELLDLAANSPGAFTFKGKMADEATLKRARAMLQDHRRGTK
jgi:citrate lyase beta subunit